MKHLVLCCKSFYCCFCVKALGFADRTSRSINILCGWILTVFVMACCLFGCSEGPSPLSSIEGERSNKIRVLSTIAMIDDLVKQIGDGYIETDVLIRGELNPHSYQLVKGDDERIARADIIFYNGLGLEHGPSLQRYLSKSPKAINLGNFLSKQGPRLILTYNGQTDPHIWMDVSLWAKTVPAIVEGLSKADPAHREIFEKNGDRLVQEMLETHQAIKIQMQAIPEQKRFIVTSHDAFNYFTRAYLSTPQEEVEGTWGKRFVAPEGLAPESQLSAVDIHCIIDHMQKYSIHVIFPESNVSRDSIRKIMQAGTEKGLNMTIATASLYADAMGKPGSDGDTYLKMMLHNSHVISAYLMLDPPLVPQFY